MTATSGMNRDAVLAAIGEQPFDADVQINVGGFLIDVIGIKFDSRRQAIVVELVVDDVDEVLRRLSGAIARDAGVDFFVTGPPHTGSGNTL